MILDLRPPPRAFQFAAGLLALRRPRPTEPPDTPRPTSHVHRRLPRISRPARDRARRGRASPKRRYRSTRSSLPLLDHQVAHGTLDLDPRQRRRRSRRPQRRTDPALRDHLVELAAARHRNDPGDRLPAVGHSDLAARGHRLEPGAQVVSKLPDPDVGSVDIKWRFRHISSVPWSRVRCHEGDRDRYRRGKAVIEITERARRWLAVRGMVREDWSHLGQEHPVDDVDRGVGGLHVAALLPDGQISWPKLRALGGSGRVRRMGPLPHGRLRGGTPCLRSVSRPGSRWSAVRSLRRGRAQRARWSAPRRWRRSRAPRCDGSPR